MRYQVAFSLCAALAAVGCKKNTTGGGGGGGGASWLVGDDSLMKSVTNTGAVDGTFELAGQTQLNGIACRSLGEAWVVGALGTLLYTDDGGESWTAQQVPTGNDLRGIATRDAGPVFVVGDGALVSHDSGATWSTFGDGETRFRSVAAAQQGTNVLAVDDAGGLWAYDDATATLARTNQIDGARAVAVSPDGSVAMIAGNGLTSSVDSGRTWHATAIDPSLTFDDVGVALDGSAIAVGEAGAIATIDWSGAASLRYFGSADLHTVHLASGSDGWATEGFAAGDDGEVLISRDSGVTWALDAHIGGTVRGVDQIGDGHR